MGYGSVDNYNDGIANLVSRLKKTDEDDARPNVDDAIRAVCLMAVSRMEGGE